MTRQLKFYCVIFAITFTATAYAAPEEMKEVHPLKQSSTNKPSAASIAYANFNGVTKKTQTPDTTSVKNKDTHNLSDVIPITAIVAIILFIAREIFDLIKKYRQEKNKKKAISFLLAEEIKINHWSHASLFRAYKHLAELFDEYPDAVYKVRTNRFDKDIFEYKREPDDKFWSGHPIPRFINEKYKSLLPSLAELDINCANILENTYEQIAELEHFRQTLVLFLANEDDEDEEFHEMTKAFIQNFTEEENDFYQALNKGHVALIGVELNEWRLR